MKRRGNVSFLNFKESRATCKSELKQQKSDVKSTVG